MPLNTADFGITIQNLICEMYNINVPNKAMNQFKSNYNPDYINEKTVSNYNSLNSLIKSIFEEIKDSPLECTTYTASHKKGVTLTPHNFLLKSGKTLSIRTNKKGDKVAPRVVGQAGYDTFNYHFGHLYEDKIETQNDIKKVIFNKIDQMLPIFIDYLLVSDYTVWIYHNKNKEVDFHIIRREQAPDMNFDRKDLKFTCGNLENWSESTTLKYKGESFAEIQVHRNRTFKFRFCMLKVIDMLKNISINNETLGMTAENSICDIFMLDKPEHLERRSSKVLEKEISPIIKSTFNNLPKPIKHYGSEKGERGGTSKSSYDFLLEGNKTLSLKTNWGRKVCPPEVGQPGKETFIHYFTELLDNEDEFNYNEFKKLVLSKVHLMMPIYFDHLFDSDYLLWIYKDKEQFKYKVISKSIEKHMIWDRTKFTFTRDNIIDWKESTTVKYKGITLGEFQVHKSRQSYKFRFDMQNLLKIIE